MEGLKPFIFQDDMLFESQFVRVRVGTKNKNYYESIFNMSITTGQELDIPIGLLLVGSREKVSVICPRCNKSRKTTFRALLRCSNSFCNFCSKQKKSDWMLGQTFGKLTVVRFGNGRLDSSSGQVKSTFICKCSCGNEVEARAADIKKGYTTSCGCYHKERVSEANYNPTITDEERVIKRNMPENYMWRKAVYERDNYTCKACSKVGGHLVAHHIVPYSTNKKLRFNVDNGITLCKTCHKEFHIDFMGGYKVKCDSSDLFNFIVLKKKSNP